MDNDISLGITLLTTKAKVSLESDKVAWMSSNSLGGKTGIRQGRILDICRGEAIPTEDEAMRIRVWFPNWEPLRVIDPKQRKIGG